MSSGFEFTFTNIARLVTLIRYERARKSCRYRAAAKCFTHNALYWEIEQGGATDRVRVQGRDDLVRAFQFSDSRAVLVKVTASGMSWNGDEMTSHWRALLRNPATGPAFYMSGFTRMRFKGFKIHEMMTVLTAVDEPVVPTRV